MANTPKVYVLCDANCRWESMTREQILTAIAQAIESGKITDVDTGFVRTIRTINNQPLRFFVGKQAEYNALTEAEKNGLFAIITDDVTKDGILAACENAIERATAAENIARSAESKAEGANLAVEQIQSGMSSAWYSYLLKTSPVLSGGAVKTYTVTDGIVADLDIAENALYLMHFFDTDGDGKVRVGLFFAPSGFTRFDGVQTYKIYPDVIGDLGGLEYTYYRGDTNNPYYIPLGYAMRISGGKNGVLSFYRLTDTLKTIDYAAY